MKTKRPAEHWQQMALTEFYMELDNGCRISMGTLNEANGYRYFGGQLVHRLAWEGTYGPIPDGLVVDHKCFNRHCVNPEHLRLLTRMQNNARKAKFNEDWPLDECRWGHKLTEQITYSKISRRRCGPCLDEYNRQTTQVKSALYRLELAYGLGGHEGKRNYAHKMRERQARVDAVFPVRPLAA